MGWPWAKDNALDRSAHTSSREVEAASKIALTDEQRLRIFGRASSSPSDTAGASPQGQADAELETFLKSFTTTGETETADTTPGARSSATAQPTPLLDRVRADGSLDISSEALLPRTMSCRQAFDQAFYCQSLGGKFNDVYRYGHLRSCSEHWGQFWFCMRTRTLPDQDRQRAIAEWYRTRDEKRKAEHGSSEDVWALRTEAVDKAFWKDPDMDEA